MDPIALGLIFLFCFLESCIKVEGRYCTYDSNGDMKYYMCQRNEYCCNFGCCLSPTFQFYQLWYYWLMVIFMFLLCSGGQWWYRYWLQGRYAGDLGSSMPYRGASGVIPQSRRPPRTARVAYHPARDAVVLQHVWKPNYPGRSISQNSPPPLYNNGTLGGSSRDSGHLERGVVGAPKPSPYFQLYGPPPSYEQVIREGRDEASVEIAEEAAPREEAAPPPPPPTPSVHRPSSSPPPPRPNTSDSDK